MKTYLKLILEHNFQQTDYCRNVGYDGNSLQNQKIFQPSIAGNVYIGQWLFEY